jgi:pSer/pThr/pTyr-binding forkhead associated (FHA) protein
LILRSGKRAGKRIPLPGAEVVIGRDEGCHIRLTSPDVSRRHCMLRCNGDEVVAADLGSRNGTHVNDVPIKGPTPLRPGDRLRVGPFLFQVPGGGEEGSSDADISGWLTEEGTLTGGPPSGVSNDTSLVPDVAGASQKTTTELRLIPTSDEASAPAPQAQPADPVVVQAAQVIREYWSTKKTR